MSYTGTVRCSYCYETGHNRGGCPDLKKAMKERLEADPTDWRAVHYFEKRTQAKIRRCSYCNTQHHTTRTCDVMKSDRIFLQDILSKSRKEIMNRFEEAGFSIGAMVRKEEHHSTAHHTGIVVGMNWRDLTHETLNDDFNDYFYVKYLCNKTGQRKTLTLTLQELSDTVISPVDNVKTSIPKIIKRDWLDGTLYDENKFFEKGVRRNYFFTANNESVENYYEK